MRLPSWMLSQTVESPETVSSVPKPRRRNLARRAMASFAHLLEEMLINETIASKPGLLQSVDARAKVVGLLGLVVCATLVHGLTTLALAYVVGVALALASAIPLRRVLRVLTVIPMFSAFIVLPALFNVVTPGQSVLSVAHLHGGHVLGWALPSSLAITDNGLLVASRFVLRTAVCVTYAYLLTASTLSHRLFRGLRSLGVPVIFILLLNMMERYLVVFVRAAEEIHMAKLSRSVRLGSTYREQEWVAAGMGALFRRTQHLGNAVHMAMVSRGYTGEVYTLDEPRFRPSDWAFVFVVIVFAVIMWNMG